MIQLFWNGSRTVNRHGPIQQLFTDERDGDESSRCSFPSLKSQSGQGLSEYVIIAVLVAIIVIVGIRYFGGSITNQYESATQEIAGLDSGGAVPVPGGATSSPESGSATSGDSEPGKPTESSTIGSSSSRKGAGEIDKEIARLRPDGVGEKRSNAADEIELEWSTLLWFGAIAVVVGVLVVFQSSRGKDKNKKKKKKFSLFPKVTKNSDGQAIVEFALVSITFLFTVMGVMQLAMCLNAYAMVRYAAYNAARAAIVHGGDQDKMLEAARLSLVAVFPSHGRADNIQGFLENYLGARATDHIPGMTYHFFKKGIPGQIEYITDVRIIDNNGGGGRTLTFDDPVDANATTVTVQVEHLYELVIPLVNRIVFYAYTMWREGGGTNETLEQISAKTNKLRRTGSFKDKEFRIPLIATYTMRLQSDYVAP